MGGMLNADRDKERSTPCSIGRHTPGPTTQAIRQ
jgi:hypothetical protein